MKHVLVGKFCHGRPTIAIIMESFIALKLKGVASVCVELDVSKPLVDKVWVSFEDDDYSDDNEGFWQRVDYDEIPQYYSKCFHMGHSVETCKRDFEKERMQAEKGKMEIGAKPAYVKRRNYRRVYNPKAAQPSKIPKPDDSIASTSVLIPEKKDDPEKFPKPTVRRGQVIKKWMEKLNQKKTAAEEVVLTKNTFASLSVDQGEIQPEPNESVSAGDPMDKNNDVSLLSDSAEIEDNRVDVNGSEVNQCGEIVDQFGDTMTEIAAIDLEEINVTFHVDSALSSPKDPKRFDNTCSEDVALEDHQALDDDMAVQLIDKSLGSIPYVE
ncbi:hypothetical protein LIER_23749 [Lithospermum erythrorhizon]|uniref:Uncharacterized protein n=1 Tax=Lithospermum erythrorhizon TaxID=34254 RepID=A0AAV3QYP3_LITER